MTTHQAPKQRRISDGSEETKDGGRKGKKKKTNKVISDQKSMIAG